MRLIMMFLLIFAPTSYALAQGSWTGKEFLDACRVLATSVDVKNDRVDDPLLVGYCAGIVHTLMIPRKYSDFKICPPENATVQQGAMVLVKFSDDHPQELNLPEVLLAPSRIPKCLALSKIRLARIGVMRALNRNVERVFDPWRKDKHWGRRKLKQDE